MANLKVVTALQQTLLEMGVTLPGIEVLTETLIAPLSTLLLHTQTEEFAPVLRLDLEVTEMVAGEMWLIETLSRGGRESSDPSCRPVTT